MLRPCFVWSVWFVLLPKKLRFVLQTMDTKRLMKKLNAANESLKKFSHVNKKALDQYVSFSEQRETILKRKNEIDAAQTAIKELIEGLDLQKDEVGVTCFGACCRWSWWSWMVLTLSSDGMSLSPRHNFRRFLDHIRPMSRFSVFRTQNTCNRYEYSSSCRVVCLTASGSLLVWSVLPLSGCVILVLV